MNVRKSCIVCGVAVDLLVFRSTLGEGPVAVAFPEGRPEIATASAIDALCDACHAVWLDSTLAQSWLYELRHVYQIGFTAAAFGRFARQRLGASGRSVKKRLVRAHAVELRQRRRARGRHDWALREAKRLILIKKMSADPALKTAVVGGQLLAGAVLFMGMGRSAA